MGFFDAPEPIDPRIATVMLTHDQRAQRALAKGQAGILAATNGAPISVVAIDEITCDTTVVVAGQRVQIFGRGGKKLERDLEAAAISSAYTEGSRFSLGGTGVSVALRDQSHAHKFAWAVNRTIVSARPRTIPPLYPRYFQDLLATARVPITPMNMARLVERTAFITGGQGAVYCAQLKDPQALEELISRFARNIHIQSDGNLGVVDQIVDWLWAWNPGCHEALQRQIKKWYELCLSPEGFLVAGADVPAWDDSDDSDNSDAWRLMYAKNQR